MPRLKVFRAHLGFYDTIVAASSRPKALEAWGATQNLFAHGWAEETKDAGAVKSALARPYVVLRRPFGESGPWSVKPDLPSMPKTPKISAVQRAQAKREAAQRRRHDKRQKRLKALEREEREAMAALSRKRASITDEEEKLHARFTARKRDA